MAKFLIVYGLEFLIGLFLLTQVIVPIFVPKLKFFWLFKGKEKSNISSVDEFNQRAAMNREERDTLKEQMQIIKDSLSDTESKIN